MLTHIRNGYNILDFLADLGGLIGILYLLANLLIGPYTIHCMTVKLMEQLYMTNTSNIFDQEIQVSPESTKQTIPIKIDAMQSLKLFFYGQ